MDKDLLCISWLDGQLKAVAMHRGAVVTSWERPGLVADFSGFKGVLAETIANTSFKGKQVAMVLAHSQYVLQILETPAAKGGTLGKFIHRRVETLKTFKGEAAWAFQSALPTKSFAAVLLHIFPKSLVDQLVGACEEMGLHLVRLVPTTAVLASQLKELPFPKNEVALLAALAGSNTTVVIGGNDGRLCLGRVVQGRWDQDPDGLKLELARTVQFVEQRSGLPVGSVWLFGSAASAPVAAFGAGLNLPVKLSPVECAPFYWAEQVAKLPETDDGNLISLKIREAPQRRQRVTMTGVILLCLMMGAVVGSILIGRLRNEWLKSIDQQKGVLGRIRDQQTDWRRRYHDLEQKRDFVRTVLDERPPPVPAWFLGYLSDLVPDQLSVTEFRAFRTNDAWSLLLTGMAEPTTNSSPAAVFRQAVTSMTNQLTSGPFHVKINRCVIGEMESLPLTTGSQNGSEKRFLVEGTFQ